MLLLTSIQITWPWLQYIITSTWLVVNFKNPPDLNEL